MERPWHINSDAFLEELEQRLRALDAAELELVQEIEAHLVKWQEQLVDEDRLDEHEADLKTNVRARMRLALDLIMFLTYQQHGSHPYYDDPYALEIIEYSRNRRLG